MPTGSLPVTPQPCSSLAPGSLYTPPTSQSSALQSTTSPATPIENNPSPGGDATLPSSNPSLYAKGSYSPVPSLGKYSSLSSNPLTTTPGQGSTTGSDSNSNPLSTGGSSYTPSARNYRMVKRTGGTYKLAPILGGVQYFPCGEHFYPDTQYCCQEGVLLQRQGTVPLSGSPLPISIHDSKTLDTSAPNTDPSPSGSGRQSYTGHPSGSPSNNYGIPSLGSMNIGSVGASTPKTGENPAALINTPGDYSALSSLGSKPDGQPSALRPIPKDGDYSGLSSLGSKPNANSPTSDLTSTSGQTSNSPVGGSSDDTAHPLATNPTPGSSTPSMGSIPVTGSSPPSTGSTPAPDTSNPASQGPSTPSGNSPLGGSPSPY